MIEIAGRGNDEIAGREALLVEIQHGGLLKGANRFLGAEDRFTERMILPEILGKDLMDQILGAILVHLDFFQNHATFTNDILDRKHRIQYQVGEHFHRDRQVLVEDFNVEADTLFGGERIEIAAYRIDLPGNSFRRTIRGSLEDHMLDKMGEPVGSRFFIPGARLNPDADGNRTQMLHLLGDDGQAVRQHLSMNVA